MKKLLFIPRAVADIASVWNKQLTLKEKSSLTYTLGLLKLKKWLAKKDVIITFPLFGFTLKGCNNEALQSLIKEIFVAKIYEWKGAASDQRLCIIDVGSNIGLSVIFFKTRFPDASVEAYEPDENAFRLLSENVNRNSLKQVNVQKAAITHNEEPLFREDGFGPCSVNQRFSSKGNFARPVSRVRLIDLLAHKNTDLVKLDIEGAEIEVLTDVIKNNCLKKVSCWLIEFHQNRQEEFIQIFLQNGFEYSRIQDVYCFTQKAKNSEQTI